MFACLQLHVEYDLCMLVPGTVGGAVGRGVADLGTVPKVVVSVGEGVACVVKVCSIDTDVSGDNEAVREEDSVAVREEDSAAVRV